MHPVARVFGLPGQVFKYIVMPATSIVQEEQIGSALVS